MADENSMLIDLSLIQKEDYAFPLLAGAGSFTTLLSLRAEYANVNIVIALILNMIWVYFVVRMTARIERFFGKGGIYIIRKFFGIILLAISVRLFTVNINLLIEEIGRASCRERVSDVV